MIGLIERIYAAAPSADELGQSIPIDTGTEDIQSLIERIISWILYIAGVLAFIYLVISGITYITAGGNADQAKKGQQGIINAVIGIVIITLAFVILRAAAGLAQTNSVAN